MKDIETVFVSVVQNDELLKENLSLVEQMDSSSNASTQLPKITSPDDVYKVGALAQIKAIHDSANPFLPYYLNIFPQQKAEIVEFIGNVEPLCRVAASVVMEKDWSNNGQGLAQKEEMVFKFL